MEVLISLAITLVVLGIVFRTVQMLVAIYERESEIAEKSAAATRAFSDVVHEIARGGYGLGEGVQAVLPYVMNGSGASSEITIRSNDEGVAAVLEAELTSSGQTVPASVVGSFAEGDKVLLTDAGGLSERAEVIRARENALAFRSLDTEDGMLRNSYSPDRGARVLKLTEIGYALEPAPEGAGNILKKDSLLRTPRVLARNVRSLRFDYLDAEGRPLSDDSLERTDLLSTVRVTMTFSSGPTPNDERTLTTAVALDAQSASVDFADPGYGTRLTRYFYPIAGPAGVAMRDFMDWGVILSSGNRDTQDRSYLYTFLAETNLPEARTESLTWLDEVREPIAMTFGPEKTALAGSLFVAASGLRIGHLARVHPDEDGVLSAASPIEVLEGTRPLAQIGGIAFGMDDTLYITSQEKGAVFRYRFDEDGKAFGPEEVFKVEGSPRALVLGTDGALYFLTDKTDESFLWKVPFDEKDTPREPVLVGALPGEGLSLAVDPLSGSLFVLIRERLGDSVVFELNSTWLFDPSGQPIRVFSLEDFAEETMEGRPQEHEAEQRRADSMMTAERLPTTLLPDRLDFLAFDHLGLLYLGAREKDLVMKFDLDRLGTSRHMVHVAATVFGGSAGEVGSLQTRLQAWRRKRIGN